MNIAVAAPPAQWLPRAARPRRLAAAMQRLLAGEDSDALHWPACL